MNQSPINAAPTELRNKSGYPVCYRTVGPNGPLFNRRSLSFAVAASSKRCSLRHTDRSHSAHVHIAVAMPPHEIIHLFTNPH